MRRIKGLFVIFLVMLSFFFALALLLPSKVTVAKWIEIGAPKGQVSREINDFEKWKNWYPSFDNKNVSIRTLPGNNVSPGRSAELQNENGQKVILSLQSSSTDTINIDLEVPGKKSVNYQFILVNRSGPRTLLVWNINYNLGWYPWQRLQGLVTDKVTGEQYASALENLRKAVERNEHDSL